MGALDTTSLCSVGLGVTSAGALSPLAGAGTPRDAPGAAELQIQLGQGRTQGTLWNTELQETPQAGRAPQPLNATGKRPISVFAVFVPRRSSGAAAVLAGAVRAQPGRRAGEPQRCQSCGQEPFALLLPGAPPARGIAANWLSLIAQGPGRLISRAFRAPVLVWRCGISRGSCASREVTPASPGLL